MEKSTILEVIIWIFIAIINAYLMRKTYRDGKEVGFRNGFNYGYQKGYDDAEHGKIANIKQYLEWLDFF